MANNPVAWFEIYIDDLARAKQFYESVLGVNLDVLSDPNDTSVEMFSFPSDMEKYGASGALVKMDGFTAGGNSTLIYFSCADCAIEESRVEAAGGRIQREHPTFDEIVNWQAAH
jgi:predicted enzyme related to lactoylglutathione lyase